MVSERMVPFSSARMMSNSGENSLRTWRQAPQGVPVPARLMAIVWNWCLAFRRWL